MAKALNGRAKWIMGAMTLALAFVTGIGSGFMFAGGVRAHIGDSNIHTTYEDTQEIARQVVAFEAWPLIERQFNEVNKALARIEEKIDDNHGGN